MRRSVVSEVARDLKIWVTTSLCMAALVSVLLFEVPKRAVLSWTHMTTQGLVTNVDKAHHSATSVQFTINGTTYSQVFPPAGLRVGALVMVRYYPSYPTVAILDEPGRALRDGLTFSAYGGVLFGTLLTLAFRFNVQKRKK
jgi:hypothetical protein